MKPKKKQIAKTARSLFTRFGIRRVTVEEICEKANVSKGTFYKYFRNKQDLVRELLELMADDGIRQYRNIMDSGMSFPDKVREMIRLKMEQTDQLSGEFIMEIMENSDEQTAAFYRQKADESMRAICADFEAARSQGLIRSDVKPEFILYFLNHMFEMVKDPKLEALYKTPAQAIMELTGFFFYGLMPPPGRAGANAGSGPHARA